MKHMDTQKTAIIIGAGPAGLTAAYELAHRTNIKPIVFEASGDIGGISKTVNYKGNLIDIGGHRFFSKSDQVMEWWSSILPLERRDVEHAFITKYSHPDACVDPEQTDEVMLIRNRLSRIYYGRKFYDYPISLNMQTIKNLGVIKMIKIAFSYLLTKFHKQDESHLEGFYINRFGRELYNTFFRDYTKKLWGIDANQIDSSWGAQRVKGLSVTKILLHALSPKKKGSDIRQKNTETSLIETFLYPKLGPGHMWETVAQKIEEKGGEVHMNHVITKIHAQENSIIAVDVLDTQTQKTKTISGHYFFSSMPMNELIAAFDGVNVPAKIKETASGLPFRDFITVGILAAKLQIKNETKYKTINDIVPDNWIYIQDPEVTVCRLQIFNNWSPYMVKDQNHVWIGMEYVVSEHDEIWKLDDQEVAQFGISELIKIGVLDSQDVMDTTVIRVKKAYPAYFGTYQDIDGVRQFTNQFDNLYLVGRNGQHRYNNQDHSMLTAIEAVNNIVSDCKNKDNVWNVNVEKEYHECSKTS